MISVFGQCCVLIIMSVLLSGVTSDISTVYDKYADSNDQETQQRDEHFNASLDSKSTGKERDGFLMNQLVTKQDDLIYAPGMQKTGGKFGNGDQPIKGDYSVDVFKGEQFAKELPSNCSRFNQTMKNSLSFMTRKSKRTSAKNADQQKPDLHRMFVSLFQIPAIFGTWPAGQFTLLKPRASCPKTNQFRWETSVVRLTTRPGLDNQNNVSKPIDLPLERFQHINGHNYVYLEMCSKVDETPDSVVVWWAGSYCIQNYRMKAFDAHPHYGCPKGFKLGFMEFFRFNDSTPGDIIVNLPGTQGNQKKTSIQFCCRQDGPVHQEIVLPYKHPIYLYRKSGACQAVAGMNVSSQWIDIDVKRYATGGIINPDYAYDNALRLFLCYYMPLNP